MLNPGDFAYTVKQQADIVRVIGDYVKLKKSGAQNFSGLCPFHGEKTASFSVHATRQFFHCFGCGVSGDVFSFVQKIENITFPEAVRAVAQKLNIALPKATFSSPAEAKEAKLRTVLLEIHERACAFFQDCLRRSEGARAREYLAGRGLNEEMIKSFRIGYAPDSGFQLRDRLRAEFGEEVLRESGLFSWKESPDAEAKPRTEASAEGEAKPSTGERRTTNDVRRLETNGQQPTTSDRSQPALSEAKGPTTQSIYSKFRNRVMFPITSEAGRILAFTGRTLSTDERSGPKYLNSPETAIYSKSRVIFNLDRAKEAIRKLDYAILVEGQMDCISVYAAGFHNVVASSGTAFTELQIKLLGRFTKNVVVNFDPDTAGARAAERTIGMLVGEHTVGRLVEEDFQIRVLKLESGFDPDLFIRQKGKDAYADALRKSQRYFDYLIDQTRSQFPIRSADGKVRALNYLLPHIQQVPSRIVRDGLAREIAQKLEIDSSALRQELKNVATDRSAAKLKTPAHVQITDAEKILIRALTSAQELSLAEPHMSTREGADEEFDPARQARFAFETERLHLGLSTEALVETLLAAPEPMDPVSLEMPDPERNLLAAILMNEEENLSAERLEGAIRGLRRIHLKRKLERIQVELQSRQAQEPERLRGLLEEKERLKRALMNPGVLEGGSANLPQERPL
jgi:DNA primase